MIYNNLFNLIDENKYIFEVYAHYYFYRARFDLDLDFTQFKLLAFTSVLDESCHKDIRELHDDLIADELLSYQIVMTANKLVDELKEYISDFSKSFAQTDDTFFRLKLALNITYVLHNLIFGIDPNPVLTLIQNGQYEIEEANIVKDNVRFSQHFEDEEFDLQQDESEEDEDLSLYDAIIQETDLSNEQEIIQALRSCSDFQADLFKAVNELQLSLQQLQHRQLMNQLNGKAFN